MSKNIIHIVCLLFLSFSVLGQDKDVIPKGINKIIFNTNLSEKENIKSIVRVLKENDYTIQKIDSISFQIETSPKNISSYTYTILFNIFERKISISSRYNSNMGVQVGILTINDGGNDVITTKGKNSIQNTIFRKMKGLVLELVDETQIQYNIVSK